MRLPFFQPKDPAAPIRIPLPEALHAGLGVYFRLAAPALPSEDQLRDLHGAWLERYADEPLRSAIRDFAAKGLLSLRAGERGMLPSPPPEILRLFNPGEIEERRFNEATHLIVASAPQVITEQPFGLWAALSAARAIAEASR